MMIMMFVDWSFHITSKPYGDLQYGKKILGIMNEYIEFEKNLMVIINLVSQFFFLLFLPFMLINTIQQKKISLLADCFVESMKIIFFFLESLEILLFINLWIESFKHWTNDQRLWPSIVFK